MELVKAKLGFCRYGVGLQCLGGLSVIGVQVDEWTCVPEGRSQESG